MMRCIPHKRRQMIRRLYAAARLGRRKAPYGNETRQLTVWPS